MRTKSIFCFAVFAALFGSSLAQAQDFARVVSAIPMMQQVSVPVQVCGTQQVTTTTPKSGAGALMGAIAGGAVGNAVGGGTGRAVATMIGVFGGAVVGDQIEGGGQTRTQDVQSCVTQTRSESRITGYSVTYEYAGRQYSVQMPQDPGAYLAVQVTPVLNAGAPTGFTRY